MNWLCRLLVLALGVSLLAAGASGCGGDSTASEVEQRARAAKQRRAEVKFKGEAARMCGKTDRELSGLRPNDVGSALAVAYIWGTESLGSLDPPADGDKDFAAFMHFLRAREQDRGRAIIERNRGERSPAVRRFNEATANATRLAKRLGIYPACPFQ